MRMIIVIRMTLRMTVMMMMMMSLTRRSLLLRVWEMEWAQPGLQ